MPSTPKPDTPAPDHVASALRTVGAEIEGLHALTAALQNGLRAPFEAAVTGMAATPGRVVVTGMGKSGHVARKVAATLASTGTPAFFLHPAEASHGDLGMITAGDVVLAFSWSGETPELRDVIHYCKRFGATLIGVASEPDSTLATASDIPLTLPKAEEACPNQLAPTTSTTMQMALGDALAIALVEARGFSAADFRNFHPGGRLGARLVTVADLMAAGADAPSVRDTASIAEAIAEISAKRLGGTAVVNAAGAVVGAFTDGDLRRALPLPDLNAPVSRYMTPAPACIAPGALATEALRAMNERDRPFMLMFVVDDGRFVGALHMHALLRAGIA